MNNDSIGTRIKHFREHFGLNQELFSEEIGWDQSVISRIERDKQEISNRFLNAMMLRFAANPDWIRTGEGEMVIAPEEYIANGIKFLGVHKYGAGLTKILNDPQYQELLMGIGIEHRIKENLNNELMAFLQQVARVWQQGDERTRKTLVQLVGAFAEGEKKEQ